MVLESASANDLREVVLRNCNAVVVFITEDLTSGVLHSRYHFVVNLTTGCLYGRYSLFLFSLLMLKKLYH